MAEKNVTEKAELDQAIEEAVELDENSGTYVHLFRRPFKWEGKEYDELAFNFESLTGRDLVAIEREMAMSGQVVMSPAMSGEFLIRMAARACGLGIDVIQAMPISDVATIRAKARTFLLRAEL